MAKSGTIQSGKKIHAQVGTRIRHVKVIEVTDQDSLTVRLGSPTESILGFTLGGAVRGVLGVARLAYSSIAIIVGRTISTKTRGTMFKQP